MIYRDFQDFKLSALGMGCMRLPVQGSDYSAVDVETTKKMIAYAFEKASIILIRHGDTMTANRSRFLEKF